MTDIAIKVGVSRTAVSHVLNARQQENIRIPDATRQRILDAAHDLGYRPNELARAVASGKTRMIGYLVEEPRYEPYWNTIIGALSEAEDLGFTLKIFSVTRATLAERVRQCVELRLGGLIVRVNNDKSLIFEEAERAKIPIVTVDEGAQQPVGLRVTADDAPGCCGAINHLVQLGHRRIAFISSGFPQLNGVEDVGSTRQSLFHSEMAARNLEIPSGYVTTETVEVYGPESETQMDDTSALSAIDALLNHPQGCPTAIFCWRDETAMLAVRRCRERGLRVPQDISIVGFSDISAARLCDPPLSTVKSPWESMGRTAMQQLAARMAEGFSPAPSTYFIASKFVARSSTGPAPLSIS